jgi:hypothetical protein
MQRGGLWYESSLSYGLTLAPNQRVGWGLELADLDNDGRLDLHLPYGHIVTTLGTSRPGQPDAVYRLGDDGVLTDVAAAWGLDHTASTRVGIPADLNNDGWLDLVKAGDAGVAHLSFARCGAAAWSMVSLRQPGRNSRAVGATVRLTAGDQTWSRRVRAGGTGFGSGTPDVLHFGLGEVEQLDAVEIVWPDGVVEQLPPFPVRSRVRVTRTP